jgi:Mitochondrial import 2
MSSTEAGSFVLEGDPSPANTHQDDDLDSLPSSDTSDSISETSDSDADREWTESLQQLELLLTMVVVPYIGKYFGRKAAYWGA